MNVSQAGATNLQLIAFNELAEAAFFNELLFKITNDVEGYELPDDGEEADYILRSLSTILAQEEVHALTANEALKHLGRRPIEPCVYEFPSTSLHEAIKLAATFTSHFAGVLQDVTARFAANREPDFARVVVSTVGQEGEQAGFFREFLDKYPSEVPTLTTSDVNYGFTYIQNFIVPGSCPNIHDIPLRTFLPLEILTPPEPRTQKIQVAWTHAPEESEDGLLWLAYINQLNVPVVVPLQVLSCEDNVSVAAALFPYDDFLLNGLTIAAVVNRRGPFANTAAVAQHTVYGPGLIVVE
ncbi:putative sexual development protein (LsdA) [Aspergillus lucknowensis]|uniref:Sexual development protein n=1 Tax=Aspergillus lucknowensis TaxID=176173 RepID=A0ABR4M2A8_9EURO